MTKGSILKAKLSDCFKDILVSDWKAFEVSEFVYSSKKLEKSIATGRVYSLYFA